MSLPQRSIPAEGFLLYKKNRVTLKCENIIPIEQKVPPGGSHCGGME